MNDGKVFLDLYNEEHPQYEHRAEEIHRADEVEHKPYHWSLGLSPLEQGFFIASIVLVLIMLYGFLSFIFGG